MLVETENKVNVHRTADDILMKCVHGNDGLYVGITDAVSGIVKFKFAEENENPAYTAEHIRSYANSTCLELYRHLLAKGLNNYGIQYLGEENPANLRTLFVVYRTRQR